MPAPSQSVLLEVLSLVVSKTSLKEQLNVEEFRANAQALWPSLLVGERLRLQVLWDLFASRPGFDAKIAALPMCWLKALEPRLGVAVDLPSPLGTLKSNEVATNAAKVFVKKDDVDRLLGPDTGVRERRATPTPMPAVAAGRTPTPVPARPGAARTTPVPGQLTPVPREPGAPVVEPGAPPVVEPGAPPVDLAEPGAPPVSLTEPEPAPAPTNAWPGQKKRKPEDPRRRQLQATVSGVVLVVSLVAIGVTLRDGCARTPKPIALRASEIPVKAGKRAGTDAQFVLADPRWLGAPEEQRRQQLKRTLDALRSEGIENVVIVDDKGAPRASAQAVGAEVAIRFY